jgi:hypothetical protein
LSTEPLVYTRIVDIDAVAQKRAPKADTALYKSAEDVRKVTEMVLKDGLASTLERLDNLLLTIAA